MADDYLWDGSGPADADVVLFERALGSLRLRPDELVAPKLPTPEAQTDERGWTRPWMLAAALLAGVGIGVWFSANDVTGPMLATPADAERVMPSQAPSTESAAIPVAPPARPGSDPAPRPSATTGATETLPTPSAAAAPPAGEASARGAIPQQAPAHESKDAPSLGAQVHGHKTELRTHCWLPAKARRDKAEMVKVALTMKVGADGRVSSATASASPSSWRDLSGCVLSQAKSWRFEGVDEAVTLTVPFVFAP